MPDCLSGDRGSIPRGIAIGFKVVVNSQKNYTKRNWACDSRKIHGKISRLRQQKHGQCWCCACWVTNDKILRSLVIFFVKVLVANSIKYPRFLCQTIWPVGCKRTLLLDGYNITCKALEISAIIKGSRGKRNSNSTPRAILRVEERHWCEKSCSMDNTRKPVSAPDGESG